MAPATAPERVSPRILVALSEPDTVAGGTLFFRYQGEETYRYRALRPAGDMHLQATIPKEAVMPPAVEWFVELRDADGAISRVRGNPMRPAVLPVTDQPDPIETANRSEVTLLAEYVDFYAGSGGADRWFHGEADFLYRLGMGPLYSMRVGSGTYRGRGGVTAELDAAGPDGALALSAPVGFNFGFTELEFRLLPWFAVMGRGMVGVDYDGLSPGAEGRVQFGEETGTSLDASAARIGDIGTRYQLRLAWNTVPKVPMAASVELTDFPGVSRADGTQLEDYGVRLIYEARYALTDHVDVGGRVGYQLRNINHAGPSGGIQTVLSW